MADTAQILQNIAAAQQERLRRMGDVQTEAAGNVGRGVQGALDSFNAGRKNQQAAEESRGRQALTASQQAGSELQNRRLQSEEDLRNATDETDPEGRTNQEVSAALDLAGKKASLAQNAQSASDQHAQVQNGIENSKAQLSSMLRTGMDDHQQHLMDNYEHQLDLAAAGNPMGPARDKAISDLTTQYQKLGLSPSVLQSAAAGRPSLVDASKAATAAAKEIGFNGSAAGITLNHQISSAQSDASFYQQLADAYTKYQSALKVPGFDAAGSVNEKSAASDARQEYAKILMTHGNEQAAKDILDTSTPWDSAANKMQGFIATGLPTAIQNWQNSGKKAVPELYTSPLGPNGAPNPEYKPMVGTVDQMFAGVQKTLGSANSAAATPALNSINPLTGQPSQQRNLSNALNARRAASGSAGAPAAPAQAPVAQPGPQAAAPAPQPGPQVVLPLTDPLLGQ